jgi:hypothetical protein
MKLFKVLLLASIVVLFTGCFDEEDAVQLQPEQVVGQDGKNGTNGTDGTDGVNGLNGEAGVSGTNGKDGVDGKQGATGPKGNKGDIGPKGDTGETGANCEVTEDETTYVITCLSTSVVILKCKHDPHIDDNGGDKVYICHKGKNLKVSEQGVDAHLLQHEEDYLGKCEEDD